MGTTLVPAGSSIFKRGGVANRALCLVLAVALVATMTVLPTGKAEAATTTTKIPVTYGQTEARSMLQMINDFRASNATCWNETDTAQVPYTNLQPLTYDYKLEQSAMLRAAELALKFDHMRPNGGDCFSAFTLNPLYSAGENIAMGYGSAQSVFMGWREDNDKYDGQGHRRNMLSSDFTSVGIGYAKYQGVALWVQNFGSPSSGAAATPANNSEQMVAIDVDSVQLKSQGLSLSYASASLSVGDTKALPSANRYVSFTPGADLRDLQWTAKNVTWTSSKPPVAYVSGGKIVAKAAGTAQLTASLDGAKAAVKVTVSAKKPAATSLKSVKPGKKKATVTWKKQTKNVSGYEVWLSTSKKFTKKTTIKKTVSKKKTSLTVKKLKAKKKYYVKIRTYYKNPTTKKLTYSKWSKVKTAKIKK